MIYYDINTPARSKGLLLTISWWAAPSFVCSLVSSDLKCLVAVKKLTFSDNKIGI